MTFSKTRNILFLLICFFWSMIIFSQEKDTASEMGIILTKNNSLSTSFLKENQRIKIKLKNGLVVVGKFKVVNDSTLSINEQIVTLDSIAKIKRRSLASAILSPVVVTYGAAFIFLGVVGTVGTGYVIFLVAGYVPGIPMVLVPLISENHRSTKWSYSIGAHPKNKKRIRT